MWLYVWGWNDDEEVYVGCAREGVGARSPVRGVRGKFLKPSPERYWEYGALMLVRKQRLPAHSVYGSIPLGL